MRRLGKSVAAACFVQGSLVMTPICNGDFMGLSFEAVTFEDEPGWQDEFLVIDVFAAFDDPTDELNAVFGEQGNPLVLTTTDPLGFINATFNRMEHPFGQGPPLEFFLTTVPAFNWDTFATIGITSFTRGLPFFFSPGFGRFPLEGTEVVITNGAWFLIPGTPEGVAGNYADLRVRFLRLSFRRPACVAGRVNLATRVDGYGQGFDGLEFAVCPTDPGTDVEVELDTPTDSHVLVAYEEVVGEGITSLAVQDFGPPLPDDFSSDQPLTYQAIGTTASYAGPIEVCVTYDESGFAHEPIVRLLHFEGGEWTDVTTFLDQVGNMVCGMVDAPSSYVVVEVADPLSGAMLLITELAEMVADLVDHPGIMNSLLVKLDTAWHVLADDNASNDGAAINVMGAFLNQLSAQSGRHIPEDAADELAAAAADIIELLLDVLQNAP